MVPPSSRLTSNFRRVSKRLTVQDLPAVLEQATVLYIKQTYGFSERDVRKVASQIPVTLALLDAWRAWRAKARAMFPSLCTRYQNAAMYLPQTRALRKAGYVVEPGDIYPGHVGWYVWHVSNIDPQYGEQLPTGWVVFHVESGWNPLHSTPYDGDWPIAISVRNETLRSGPTSGWFCFTVSPPGIACDWPVRSTRPVDSQ